MLLLEERCQAGGRFGVSIATGREDVRRTSCFEYCCCCWRRDIGIERFADCTPAFASVADVAGVQAIRCLSIAAAGGGDGMGECSSSWSDSRIRFVDNQLQELERIRFVEQE